MNVFDSVALYDNVTTFFRANRDVALKIINTNINIGKFGMQIDFNTTYRDVKQCHTSAQSSIA